jgi:indole-3-acetate monooxygenase
MSIFTEEEVETIQQNAEQAEHTKTLAPQVMDIVYKHKLLKLFVPAELGGKQETLPNALKIFEDCAYIDGTVGFLAAIGSGGGYFAGYYSPETSARLFANDKAVLAGSGTPCTATKTNGGYIVNGSWKYCSGANFATFFTATATDENGQTKAYTFMPEQVTILNDWTAFGLKATASNTIVVNDVFVPHELVFDLAQPPISHPHYKLYSFPFLLFAQYSFAAVVLGLYRAFVNGVYQLNGKYPADSSRNKAVGELLNKATQNLDMLTNALHKSARITWGTHTSGEPVGEDLLIEGAENVFSLSTWASQTATNIFAHAGMAVVMENHPLNRIYRNLLTANQHILLRKY